MRPIKTEETNIVFTPPEGMLGCDPLPAKRVDGGHVVTVWELTAAERQAIADGCNIELHVWLDPTPPVGLRVTNLTEITEGPSNARP